MKGVNQYIYGYLQARRAVAASVESLFDGPIAITDDNTRKIEQDVSDRLNINPSCINVDIKSDHRFDDEGAVSVRFAVGGNVWYVDKEAQTTSTVIHF